MEQGYLNSDKSKLTSKALDFFNRENKIAGFRAVLSAYLPLYGEVSAGRGRQFDDLAVYLDDTNNDDTLSSVAIPNIIGRTDEKLGVLRVRGVSMENAGILNDDYVIVKLKKDYEEGQIVVAKYLSEDDEGIYDEELYAFTEIELTGPTLKVYRGEIMINGEKKMKLGRLRDYGQINPFEIKTKHMEVIGIVIGIYRDLNKTYR